MLPRREQVSYYIVSAHGQDGDWTKHIDATLSVHVQIRDLEFDATAEPVTDPVHIADFNDLRLPGHKTMIRLILCLFDD